MNEIIALTHENNSSIWRITPKSKFFRERLISRRRESIVSDRFSSRGKKESFSHPRSRNAHAVRHFQFRLISAQSESLLFFHLFVAYVDSIAFLFMRLAFSAHPEHRVICLRHISLRTSKELSLFYQGRILVSHFLSFSFLS